MSSQIVIESLSRDHGAALLGWAQGRFSDPRDAEEVVAETLVRAWRGIDQFDPGRGSLRSWLFGIARTTAADHYRKIERERSTTSGSTLPPQVVHDAELERFVEGSHIRDALDTLSADHRAAVVAAYYDGMSTAQIADRDGIPAGTVKSRLYYALKAMRGHLEERGVMQ